MKKTPLYAAKNLTLAGKAIKRGDVVATIETDHDLLRICQGLAIGHLTEAKPESLEGVAHKATPEATPAKS